MNKRELAILLSKLDSSKDKNVKLEQYQTDSEIAGEVIWNAFMLGDIEGKVIADFGCGNGILGIGALVLGASKATLVDIDEKAISIAKENLKKAANGKKLNALFENKNISKVKGRFDTVLQNPPFGTKTEHADREFLLKAMECSDVVYSFHKSSTESFVKAIAKDNGFEVTHKWLYKFPLKHSYEFHRKKVAYADVGVYRLARAIHQCILW
ncbi:MAG: METTL5 family protein [Candidatus Nanoarchaeia archaeon]|nr:METTL5 family protein [Candidatus Nanoarchaeia archaeon]